MTLETFSQRLAAELEAYAEQSMRTATLNYGPEAVLAVQRLHEVVAQDATHISGLLTLTGYALEGGTDESMIIQAARAMELIRASHASDGLVAETARQQAYTTLANLFGCSDDGKLKAISICARSSLLYAHGRMPDADFTNPMHVGMVLADADCGGTDDITPFTRALAEAPDEALAVAAKLASRWQQAGLLKELATKCLQS